MEQAAKITRKCAHDACNLLGKVFYIWTVSLFNVGWSRPLNFDDLLQCPKRDDPILVTSLLEVEWKKELFKGKKNASLIRAFARAFIKPFLIYNSVIFISEICIRLTQPFMIGYIIRYLKQPLDTPVDDPKYISKSFAQSMAALLVITSFVFALSRHYCWICLLRVGNNARTATTAMIYKKVLAMSRSSSEVADIGQVINIIANDLNRFEEIAWNANTFICVPPMVAIAIYISYSWIGFACASGFIVILILVPLQSLMGRWFVKYRRQTTVVTDKRVRIISEVISAMRLIKFYCWEIPFAALIGRIREDEVAKTKKTYFLKATNSALSFVGSNIIIFASLVTYVKMGNTLEPETVYMIISLFNGIRMVVTNNFSAGIATGAEALVAANRVQKLLLISEKSTSGRMTNASIPRGCIKCVDYSGKWHDQLEETSLQKISYDVEPGSLVMVVGSVGAGKTCLLWSLLGEIHHTSGMIKMNGNTSYSAQESWCFGGTIRQNILLTNAYDEYKYRQVIKVCNLERDFTLFAQGDLTQVGEKGYTLSGGQKARVALARAVYHDADYYILDDVLSAVDPKVARNIFEKCIKEHLKNKTVILVTHQLQFLDQADSIIYMQDGKAVAVGPYNDLIKNNKEFSEYLDNCRREQEKEAEAVKRTKSLSVNREERADSESYSQKNGKTPSISESIRLQHEVDSKQREEDLQENREYGSLGARIYWDYFKAGSSYLLVIAVIIITIASQSLFHLTDLWMSAWTSKATKIGSDHSTVSEAWIFDDENHNVALYSILVWSLFILSFLRSSSVFALCLRCSINLHDGIFKRILRSPMLFFETNPMGRILNRFARDLGIIDQALPITFSDLNYNLFSSFGVVITTIVVQPWMIIPCILLTAFAVPLRFYYIRTARELQRLDSIARTPVYTHITETFNGLATVRSFDLQSRMSIQYAKYLKDSISVRFLVLSAGRFFGIVLDTFVCIFMMCICVLLLEMPKGTISGGDAGVILSNSIWLIGMFQFAMRLTAEIETAMVSVERVLEYGRLPSEDKLDKPGVDENLPEGWPKRGHIEFNKVSLRYSPDTPYVLQNVTIDVKPGEKIGIVGRTGAGKSSLITVLFRLVECEGQVLVDGIDLRTLGLRQVRKNISIIPQDPSLFSGSIRKNLDPFDEHTDNALWSAVKEAGLGPLITSLPGKLDGELMEGGSNLSVGQRQLLCLARALLKQNRILVLDEATANVDQETDDAIQLSIRTNFANCTILTIAHRLNTIIDMDKVLVMGAGQVLEYDEPYILLQNREGHFYSMIQQTGRDLSKQLYSLAEGAYAKRRRMRRMSMNSGSFVIKGSELIMQPETESTFENTLKVPEY